MLDSGGVATRTTKRADAGWRGLLLACLLLVTAVAAAAPSRALRFSQLSLDDGLPQESQG